MSFVDINLGWPNYVQLAEKGVPEFKNNIIVLDGDVPQKREYRSKAQVIQLHCDAHYTRKQTKLFDPPMHFQIERTNA